MPELTPDTSHLTPARKRGGRRPGAGAPRGNLNALKHGRRSRQFATIGAILSADPRLRDTLLALARRHDDKNARAQEVAGDLLARLIIHAREVAQGKASPGPFAGIARLNIVRKALSDARSTKASAALEQISEETQNALPHNQTPRGQSNPRYETTPD